MEKVHVVVLKHLIYRKIGIGQRIGGSLIINSRGFKNRISLIILGLLNIKFTLVTVKTTNKQRVFVFKAQKLFFIGIFHRNFLDLLNVSHHIFSSIDHIIKVI